MDQRDVFARLAGVIEQRKAASPTSSYVAALMAGGVERIGGKVREEAAELCEAAAGADRSAIVHEAADLAFHVLVLLGHRDVSWGEIEAELQRRFGTSGLMEKAARRRG
ncbi:MAG: phosphoribosyl-ATP diphosphatase [Planctomycetota bacterium]